MRKNRILDSVTCPEHLNDRSITCVWCDPAVEPSRCSVEMDKLSSRLVSFQTAATDLQQLSGTLSVQATAGCQWYTTKRDSKRCLGLQLDHRRREAASSGTDSLKALRKMLTALLLFNSNNRICVFVLLQFARNSNICCLYNYAK